MSENRFQMPLRFRLLLLFLPVAVLLVWVLVRIGTFFLLPTLDDGLRETVNVSRKLWLVVVELHAIFFMVGFVAQAVVVLVFRESFVSTLFVSSGLLVLLVSILLGIELMVSMIFPSGASLGDWMKYTNTLESKSIYTQVIKASPIVVERKAKGGRYFHNETLIENWNCVLPAIRYRKSLDEKYAGSKLCVDVHTGMYGWTWIDNLRSCGTDELINAAPLSKC